MRPPHPCTSAAHCDREIQLCAGLVPYAAIVGNHHAETVVARSKIVIERLPARTGLLEPFPYANSHRLVTIEIHDSTRSDSGGRSVFRVAEFLELQGANSRLRPEWSATATLMSCPITAKEPSSDIAALPNQRCGGEGVVHTAQARPQNRMSLGAAD